MTDAFIKVKNLIGETAFTKLQRSSVLLFGVGGVGGYVAEALVRSGVGSITVVDGDTVAESNLNRQIIATTDSLGKDKTEVIANRLRSINPDVKVAGIKAFFLPDSDCVGDFKAYDYIIDAVDTVTAKIEIILRAKAADVPVISCMGTGGKLFPDKLKLADIKDTKGCPLARVMRRELKKRDIVSLPVVYSEEESKGEREKSGGGKVPSMVFVPATAGILIANKVVLDLINYGEKK